MLPFRNRGRLRARYGLEGNGWKDLGCAICAPFNLVQQYREIEHQHPVKTAEVVLQPAPVEAMVYSTSESPLAREASRNDAEDRPGRAI